MLPSVIRKEVKREKTAREHERGGIAEGITLLNKALSLLFLTLGHPISFLSFSTLRWKLGNCRYAPLFKRTSKKGKVGGIFTPSRAGRCKEK